mmetsp:Transcript_35469/g.97988  ORF Transcript_35469/g.97988 Transcript_35469/m.97988 type:complete len:287 (-) Transcript_35469:999-1859(-)
MVRARDSYNATPQWSCLSPPGRSHRQAQHWACSRRTHRAWRRFSRRSRGRPRQCQAVSGSRATRRRRQSSGRRRHTAAARSGRTRAVPLDPPRSPLRLACCRPSASLLPQMRRTQELAVRRSQRSQRRHERLTGTAAVLHTNGRLRRPRLGRPRCPSRVAAGLGIRSPDPAPRFLFLRRVAAQPRTRLRQSRRMGHRRRQPRGGASCTFPSRSFGRLGRVSAAVGPSFAQRRPCCRPVASGIFRPSRWQGALPSPVARRPRALGSSLAPAWAPASALAHAPQPPAR